jgi:hypothetical protein
LLSVRNRVLGRRQSGSNAAGELAKQRFLIFVLGGTAVAIVVLFILLQNYELIRTTPIPNSNVVVYKVRLFDSFDVQLKNEVKPTPDVFNSAILLSISSMALLALLFLERAAADVSRSLRWFFVSVWLGFAFLAGDELLAFHETIGQNLGFLADLPGVEEADDVVFAAYLIPVLVFLIAFRRILFSSPAATRFFALGVIFFVTGAAADLIHIGEAEDFIEILGSAWFFAGFVIVMIDRMLDGLRAPSTGIAES